jgi:penicillin amidase
MRSSLIVAVALLLEGSLGALGGCGSGSAAQEPSLTITPSALSSPITDPTVFTAVLVNSTDDVTWTVTGDGTLSNTSGLHVTYAPKFGGGMATLTATTGKLTATVQIASTPPTKGLPGLTAPVTVQYDAQDVPHIQCAQAADCLAAQGYLQARDRLFPMDFLRHVARGKVAELVGPNGLSQDIQFRTLFTTRDGKRIENELVKAIDPATKALLDAFVGGINAYLAELRASHGALPGEYAQLLFPISAADIADWTEQDTLAIARLNQFQLSESLTAETANGMFALTYGPGAPHLDLGKLNAWIRAAAPTTEQGHTLSATGTHAPVAPATAHAQTLPGKRPRPFELSKWRGVLSATAAQVAAVRERLRPADATVGSNNWVVAGAKSATHLAMVANDPHLSLQYPPLFHLATMTSSNAADHLKLAGGSFPGIPGALVGRGERVGWGVTVVGYDVTDIYLEQFMSQGSCPGGASGPLCVQFKGGPVSTVVAPQTYLVRVGAGASGLQNAATLGLVTAQQALVLVVPHHGPVIQAPDGSGKGVSFRWTGHEPNTQDLKAFYGLNTAASVDAAITALKDYATGAQNFVLADDQGHIGYDPHALVPLRRFADARQAAFDPAHPPWFPVPGDDGNHEWGDGVSDCANPAGVPASCWTPDDQLPQGKDPAKGYFFTANADPTSLASDPNKGVSDDNNPLAHPPYLSFDWDDSSGFRATRIEQRLEAALNASGSVSLADMESIQADHVSRPGMAFESILLGLPTSGAPPELAAAQGVIQQWKASGWDCPSGVIGSAPKGPADTTAAVVQNSAGCFLFHEFLRTLVTNVFADDLKVAGQGINALAAVKALLFMLSLDPNATTTPAATTFCNDVDATGNTVASKTCGAQVVTALVQAYDTLVAQVGPNPSSWTWGRVHTIRPVSLLALVTTGYEPGPFARPGGAFTVDVGNPSLSSSGLDFAYGSGGNVRHISLMDPVNPKIRMQLPGPERDGPAVGPGPDLLGQWVKNSYFDYAFGDQIKTVAVSIQTFKAP